MRTRHNDPAHVDTGDDDGASDPVRSCILTRERDSRDHLVRLVLGPDGLVYPDVRAKAGRRGAWIGVPRTELEVALAKGKLKGALARAFKTTDFAIAPDLPQRVADALERNALDRLGLEARSGTLLTGSDRIEAAARSGKLHALYHAADARADGAGKLAQAWRVGSDREGSDLKGLALPAPRTILGLALGRENVVHIGLTDSAAAKRVSGALDRWLHFIGPEIPSGSRQGITLQGSPTGPCAKTAQGASAPEAASGPGETPSVEGTHEDIE